MTAPAVEWGTPPAGMVCPSCGDCDPRVGLSMCGCEGCPVCAWWREECACGHRRSFHGALAACMVGMLGKTRCPCAAFRPKSPPLPPRPVYPDGTCPGCKTQEQCVIVGCWPC